jgi:hypothetical protein
MSWKQSNSLYQVKDSWLNKKKAKQRSKSRVALGII